MLRSANTPENISAAVDYMQRCNDTDSTMPAAPLDSEELAQAIREFVASYAEPVLEEKESEETRGKGNGECKSQK